MRHTSGYIYVCATHTCPYHCLTYSMGTRADKLMAFTIKP